MQFVCYIWVYKAACVWSECWEADWLHKEPAELANIQKGLVKGLIRRGQAAYIKTWWDNRPVQTELQFYWLVIQGPCQAEKVNASGFPWVNLCFDNTDAKNIKQYIMSD